ncbi:MAG: OmpA family protein [Pararhodobacter sp.]|nr:OmpA family protein [Pararhodobacter sp.]
MRFTPAKLLSTAGFGLAAVLALLTAWLLAVWVERHNDRALTAAFAAESLDWVEYSTDGLRASLWGMAPDEAARIRAMRIAGSVVDGRRIEDEIVVGERAMVLVPEFRVELMRNHHEISVVGLVPATSNDEGEAELLNRLAAIEDDIAVSDMLQSAAHPAPQGWRAAVDFAVEAITLLPVAQLSVSPRRIEVHALVDSVEVQAELAQQLRGMAPTGQRLVLDLVAPRPVIAPFTLLFEIDDEGPRLTACSAETDGGREQIIRAARAAGAEGRLHCASGLGAPSPRWGLAGELAIMALADLGQGSVSISDADILLVVAHDVSQARLDRVVGRLETALPEVFALNVQQREAEVPDLDDAREERALLATLDEDGQLLIEGRLPDTRIREAVHAFARARFGSGVVTLETRLDPDLPSGWSGRALTGLEALAELHHGRMVLHTERLELSGISGDPDAGSRIAGILTEGLGQGADYVLRVQYDEALDPVAQAPTPDRCEARIHDILAEYRLTFAPGSADLDNESREALNRIAEVLIECGELPLEVAGHTDSQGREETNLALSQARAESVVNALMTRRVLVGSMVPRGYGPSQPIADNATAEGREANRRIEITLIRPEPEPEPLDPALEAELEFEIQTPDDNTTRPEPRAER